MLDLRKEIKADQLPIDDLIKISNYLLSYIQDLNESIGKALDDVDTGNYDSCSAILTNASWKNEGLHLDLKKIISGPSN